MLFSAISDNYKKNMYFQNQFLNNKRAIFLILLFLILTLFKQ